MLKCVRFYGRAIDCENINSSYIHHSTISYHTKCLLLHFPLNFKLLSLRFFFLYSSGSITSAAAAAVHETSDCNQGLVGMYKSSIEEDPKPLTPQSPCYNQVGITLHYLSHLPQTAASYVFTCHQDCKP